MISVFEVFKIGIGPSSSHTVGPMRAARSFVTTVGVHRARIARVRVTLFGSLAWTGKGHGTDLAVIAGLSGRTPETVDPQEARELVERARTERRLDLPGIGLVPFDPETDIVFDCIAVFERHPNAMRFEALDREGNPLASELWFSIGGGFVVREDENAATSATADVPYPFRTAADLMARSAESGLSIADVQHANELALRSHAEIDGHLRLVVETMFQCIDRGIASAGDLPGGLKVARRAKTLKGRLEADRRRNLSRPHEAMDYVSLYAIAVSEENAAGGRVVTAPTNGAAGVIPAVLAYLKNFCPEYSDEAVRVFLLTATAIAALYKVNASISGAEVGCQGEVGVACSMAAAGLCAALGGTAAQVENAAEIAMEHHLGMTCDPVGGLVQIPCIERNALGAVKAVTSASLALRGDGTHKISLDQVIQTMRQTGADMLVKYKETSQGGLAVSFTEC